LQPSSCFVFPQVANGKEKQDGPAVSVLYLTAVASEGGNLKAQKTVIAGDTPGGSLSFRLKSADQIRFDNERSAQGDVIGSAMGDDIFHIPEPLIPPTTITGIFTAV